MELCSLIFLRLTEVDALLGAHLADFLFTTGPRGDGFATIGVQRFPPSL